MEKAERRNTKKNEKRRRKKRENKKDNVTVVNVWHKKKKRNIKVLAREMEVEEVV